MSPGLIFPRCLCVSGHVVRAICVSPGRTSRIRHQKALTEKAWEDAAEGLGKPWYTLFTPPPPPFPPAAPALSLIFLGTTVIPGREIGGNDYENCWGINKVTRITGSVKMVNLVPLIKQYGVSSVLYYIKYTLIRCEVEATISLKLVLFYNQDR